MSTKKLMMAEAMGTAWLVLGGCGAAILAGAFPALGIGYLGIALAFAFALVTATFAFGHISGGHFNPAVTLGLVAAGKFCSSRIVPYIIAQVAGALIGAGIIYLIASGQGGFDATAGFFANGFGENSPGGFDQQSAFIAEAVLTFFFVTVFLHVCGNAMSALPLGMALGVIHLISLPITHTGVNPARSIGQAVFQKGWAMDQLWLFIAAPIVGAIAAGWLKKMCCAGEACSTSSCNTDKGSCQK